MVELQSKCAFHPVMALLSLETLVEDTRRSIWHAFTALAKGKEGKVAKSSLKVLTNNIGQVRGSEKAEEIIDDGNTDTLSFKEYFSLILDKVLLPNNSESVLVPETCTKIDKLCWLLCETHYHKNSRLDQGSVVLNSDDLFKLWKVFNFLVKVDLDSAEDKLTEAVLPLEVDVEESYRVGSLIRQAVGYSTCEYELVDPTEENRAGGFSVGFVQFINNICVVTNGLSAFVMREAVSSVTEQFLCGVMMKGYMEKFGNHVTTWKRRWFRLTGNELQYFTSDSEQEMKGNIEINKKVRLENLPQRPSHKPFRFKVHTANRSFEMAAPDLRSKNEWLVVLQKVSDYSGQEGSIQKIELLARERARRVRRDKAEEQLFDKLMMRQKLQNRDEQLEHELQERKKDRSLLEKREQELEAERLARLETEARLAEEEEALESERQRLKELEAIRIMLERLLKDERQAKKDEETVRNLQSRLLLEETEKREQLEALKQEQERLLQQEREEKEGLEQQRREQQALLNAAQDQLNLLAEERLQAEQQFREAEEKMQLAEAERRKMEERLRLREMTTSVALRRPKPLADPDPFVTHRGKGAFVDADFGKKTEDSSATSLEEEASEEAREES
ncbi:uncharacterized protein LOC143288413 [Babylonia areolata]|uniref:uncharacterized protein LOC143288413 n=1 Tax=Babylonia areolata TaxID=304850 RepID=UPI003FD19A8B